MSEHAITWPLPCPERLDVWREVARVIEPKVRVRPSTWAEQNIRLRAGDAANAGPMDMDYMPWTREVMDVMFDHPGKKGMFCMKPSQIGFTYCMLALLVCYCMTDPGPMLYVIDRVDKTQKFYGLFLRWLADNPRLQEKLISAKASPVPTITLEGMEFDFHTAGSEGGFTSVGRRYIAVDELEASLAAYPKERGDLIGAAKGRFPAYADSSELLGWGHPGSPDKDVDLLINQPSTWKMTWVWDCPHCGGTVNPDWTCVHFGDITDDDRLNPAAAVFRCPSCGEVITDGQRIKQVRSRRWQGGTGRFEGEEPDDGRSYIGLIIHRLSAPNVTVRALAEDYVAATRTGDLRTFYNKSLGETHKPKAGLITPEEVLACVKVAEREIILPGGNSGAQYVTVGVDVQDDEKNPTLYATAVAWAPTGIGYVIAAERMRGWAAYLTWLSVLRWRVQNDGGGMDWMTPAGAFIDCANQTKATLSACRLEVLSIHTGAVIPMIPIRFQAHMTAVVPAKLSAQAKRLDPLRPSLGYIELYDLHDDTWITRAIHRVQDNRLVVLCRPPDDWVQHLTARVQVQKKTAHGWAETATTWEKLKKRKDDWLMTLVHAEVGASIKFGLDRLHEILHPAVPSQPASQEAEQSWIPDVGDRWIDI